MEINKPKKQRMAGFCSWTGKFENLEEHHVLGKDHSEVDHVSSNIHDLIHSFFGNPKTWKKDETVEVYNKVKTTFKSTNDGSSDLLNFKNTLAILGLISVLVVILISLN